MEPEDVVLRLFVWTNILFTVTNTNNIYIFYYHKLKKKQNVTLVYGEQIEFNVNVFSIGSSHQY